MDDHDKLGAMFAVMEEQQAAVQAAIAGMAQERKAMAAVIDSIKGTSGTLQQATGDAAARAVMESIGQAPKTAVAALNQAVGALDEAAGQVRSAGAWLTFKAAASVAGAGLVMVLAVYALGHFMLPSEADRQEVEQLRAEKAQLETNIANLAKRGGRIKLERCGPANRLCVEITPAQGEGQGQADFQGAWLSNDRRHQYVIPKGY
mgnify:FL=1